MPELKIGRLARAIALAFALSGLLATGFASSALAQQNLLLNPDLVQGANNAPLSWDHQSWRSRDDSTPFQWLLDEHPAELAVLNQQVDDARWIQPLRLDPGWYHFTASVRTEDVGTKAIGANISILEGWIGSRHIEGTSDWQPIGFFLKVGPSGADVTLACRLGLYGSVNTGKAFFRDLQATPVDGATLNGDPTFDWDKAQISNNQS